MSYEIIKIKSEEVKLNVKVIGTIGVTNGCPYEYKVRAWTNPEDKYETKVVASEGDPEFNEVLQISQDKHFLAEFLYVAVYKTNSEGTYHVGRGKIWLPVKGKDFYRNVVLYKNFHREAGLYKFAEAGVLQLSVNLNVVEKKVIGDVTEESSLKIVSVIDKDTYGYGSVSKNNNDSNLEKSYMKKSCTLKHAEKLERELKTMLHFRANPFIVQASCPHLHFEYNTKSATLCYIYMEYASLGNLDKMISDAGGKLPEDSVRRATRMILQGLKALHAEGYLHCDLKPSNVFVFPSSRPGEPWDLKLTGFGLSKDPTMDSMLLFPGTREYMPPEATMPNMFSGMDRLIGPSRDIWSLGHTVLRMLGGILEEMGHSIAWTTGFYISPVATDFYMWCCKLRPTERPTIDELLDHPFVAERPSSFHEVSIFSKEQSYFRRHDELIPQHPIPDPLGTFNRFVNRSLHYPATR